VKAKEVTIAMGNFEPYFIQKGNTGIFADLISAVFHHMPNYEPKFNFGSSNKTMWSLFEHGRVDAVSNVFDSVEVKGCRSNPIFRFRDVAVTQKTSGLHLNSYADLSDKKIISFEGATGFFGNGFTHHLSSRKYFETAMPSIQARMLIAERVQVSIGDLFIFLNALEDPINSGKSISDFNIHYIFPQISSRMAFRDQALCEKFNIGLKRIIENGEYENIYNKYLKNFDFE